MFLENPLFIYLMEFLHSMETFQFIFFFFFVFTFEHSAIAHIRGTKLYMSILFL